MLFFLYFFLFFTTPLLYFHIFKEKHVKGGGGGVREYPLIGCLISFHSNRGRILEWYTGLVARSCTHTIVLTRPGAGRTIVTANPENVEYMLKTNFCNYPKGGPFISVMQDLLGDGIFNVDGGLWMAQRKLAAHGFTPTFLKTTLMHTMREELHLRFLPLLHLAAQRNTLLDLQLLLQKFSFSLVCRLSLGVDISTKSKSADLLMKAFEKACEVIARRGRAPIPYIWKVKRAAGVGSEGELRDAVNFIHSYVGDIIEMKKTQLKHNVNGNDILSKLLLTSQHDNLIRDMVISFIMAGKDTTSAAMTWLFWQLSQKEGRKEEEEIIKEVKRVTGEGELECYESLKEMGFTEACLMEAMRLFPPVAWDSKHAVREDVLPDGTAVHGGDRVTYFPYGMGRIGALWGEDCAEFRPERWLLEGVGGRREVRKMSPYKYPVFQAGPRVCLGKDMALFQMKYVVGSLVCRFKIIPLTTSSPPVYVPLLTAHMQGGFRVVIKEREMDKI